MPYFYRAKLGGLAESFVIATRNQKDSDALGSCQPDLETGFLYSTHIFRGQGNGVRSGVVRGRVRLTLS